MGATYQILGQANQHDMMSQVRYSGLPDAPQFDLKVDHQKALAMGIPVSEINSTMAVAWGSSYVNDFLDRGQIKRVYVQADAPYRMLPDDITDWYVRNTSGEMVPFSSFSEGNWTYGAQQLQRYNGVPSINIQGSASPGFSTGDAMVAMEDIASQLPDGLGFEWTGLSVSGSRSR